MLILIAFSVFSSACCVLLLLLQGHLLVGLPCGPRLNCLPARALSVFCNVMALPAKTRTPSKFHANPQFSTLRLFNSATSPYIALSCRNTPQVPRASRLSVHTNPQHQQTPRAREATDATDSTDRLRLVPPPLNEPNRDTSHQENKIQPQKKNKEMPSDPIRRYKSPADLTRAHPPSPSPTPPNPNTTTTHPSRTRTTRPRTTPYLPTPTELFLLSLYPTLLTLGSLYALLNPSEIHQQQHHLASLAAHAAPSYFARKDNVFNTLFVKKGWAWISGAFAVFLFTHPAMRGDVTARVRAGVRWVVVTGWWVVVTRWFFGPGLVDRGFLWSGGACELGADTASGGNGNGVMVGSAVECKGMGGRWKGGHDVSGHVFLLVLGSWFLVQEVGWVVARRGSHVAEERSVVMGDGAVKGAGVEGRRERDEGGVVAAVEGLGHGGRFAVVVVGLCAWMLLMTAIYFHTWLEKVRLFGFELALFLEKPADRRPTAQRAPVRPGRAVRHIHPPALGSCLARCRWAPGDLVSSGLVIDCDSAECPTPVLFSVCSGWPDRLVRTPVSPQSLAGTGTVHRPDMTSSKKLFVSSLGAPITFPPATHSLLTLASHTRFPRPPP